ncbi:Uu.00g108050.m01.CDS01 [Anthostomella pinea]|uniref:pectinesterase n=1 Tax=Anthostomella pinea TaxID=933095 RepID=A0AAI8VEB7_9PEZI|nr:Uu.00g108050.m01.CDS01 [Anthostomella pinea]
MKSLYAFVVAVVAVVSPLVLASSTARRARATHAAPVRTYADCQRKTWRPLQGCPPGTLFVSQNSSRVSFTTIQSAIDSLPHDNSSQVILVAPGTYTEQLNVTRPRPLTLLGMSDAPSQGKAYADVTSDTDHRNEVQVVWAAGNTDNTGKLVDNAITSVLTVAPTWNASLTGTGPTGFAVPADTPFGSADFRAYNIDFRNTYALEAAGPALALTVGYANAGFYACGFYSYQDTVYVGKLGNAFFYDSVVAGQVDFLYGFGTAWVERSTLALRNCGGGITAWKGTNTTFTNKYGVYVASSRVIAANDTIAAEIAGQCALGRPWNAQHRSIFLNTYLDASIKPEGYIEWGDTDPRYGNTTFMAVYDDNGPGYDVEAMKAGNVTIVLDSEVVEPYRSPAGVFITPEGATGNVLWIDGEALASKGI